MLPEEAPLPPVVLPQEFPPNIPDNQANEKVVRCRANFPFTKRKDGELSFIKGDVITVLKSHKSGWWKGEFNGQTGLFPANYCKIIED